jgi:hypothetical protein
MAWVVFKKPISIKTTKASFVHDAGEIVELDEKRAKHYIGLGYCDATSAPVKSFQAFSLPGMTGNAKPRRSNPKLG